MEQGRRELAKANSGYALKVTLGKQKWLVDKEEHDKKRLATMPSRFSQLANGTNTIQTYMRINAGDQIKLMVGSCLGDIVDLTVMQAEGKLSTNTKYPDFVPPPAPALPQQFRQQQQTLKNEHDRLAAAFNQLEEQRRVKWRKYMGARAEIEVKHGVSSRRTAATYSSMPCPQLNRATQQSIPNLQFPTMARAGYTPINRPPSSDPKYSAAKVKQRIATDGSVAPVSEPKKTKDGLYMRPSGRTRKGMQWDALRGLWVPENYR